MYITNIIMCASLITNCFCH